MSFRTSERYGSDSYDDAMVRVTGVTIEPSLVKAALGGLASAPRRSALHEKDHETGGPDAYSGPAGMERICPTVAGEQYHHGGCDPQADARGDDRCGVGQARAQHLRFWLTLHEM